MGSGATGALTLDAYPSREAAFVGAQYKTLQNTEKSLAGAKAGQAASQAAHESHVAGAEVELAEARAEYERRCEGISKADVKVITDAFEERRAQLKQDEAEILAIRNRRR